MRQSHKHTPVLSSVSEVQFLESHDPIQQTSSYPNILDQAFILYSDDDMISASSQSNQSNLSFDSRSVAYSQKSELMSHKNDVQIIGNFIHNDQSSICDVRQSQCSESGKELLQSLQPLFCDNLFRRRSPRFVAYGKTVTTVSKCNRAANKNQDKSKKLSLENLQMSDDEKMSPNQVTQILQEKEQRQLLMNNDTYSKQKCLQNYRVTRSKKVNQTQLFCSKDVTRDNTLSIHQNTNDFLSQITKDFIMTTRKQKKIKKAQKDKNHLNHRNHHYFLRKN